MFRFYTSIIIMCWLTQGALCILVWKNNRISNDGKRLLYLTYALIAFSTLAEWFGVYLDGRSGLPQWMLRTAKCMDYILTPMAGGALVLQMNLRNRWEKVMFGILAVNTVLQLSAAGTNWVFSVDASNHYTHGPLFPAYFGVCLLIYLLIIIQFSIYGQAFLKQNRSSLYAVMFLVLAGIGMQEAFAGIRTACLGMTIGAALMFIHYSEFSQLEKDVLVSEQQVALNTDPLTGLLNRYAYSRILNEYEDGKNLPEDVAAFTIDINGLKRVNDTLGHEAGDELIRGAADCIERVFKGARCFRTGGDEFVVLARGYDSASAESALSGLEQETRGWRGTKGQRLNLAAGFALAKDSPDITAEELVRESDMAMYTAKAEYYRKSGLGRHRSFI